MESRWHTSDDVELPGTGGWRLGLAARDDAAFELWRAGGPLAALGVHEVLAASRLLSSFLYGVATSDVTYAVIIVVVGAAGMLAA